MAKINEKINRAAEILNDGGLVILPAGTVYGIFCRADEDAAVRRIYAIKSRDEKKPLQVFLDSVRGISKYAFLGKNKQKKISEFLPGPFTVILKSKKTLPALAGGDTIGIRVIKGPFINSIIKKVKAPLAATSANISGKKTPAKFRDIPKTVLNSVDYAYKKDTSVTGKPSGIIDLTGEEVRVLKRG